MFLQDVPLTGIAFCYAPLLLTVLGFILFAGWTDLNARRTYLRREIADLPLQPYRVVETPTGAEVMVQNPRTPTLDATADGQYIDMPDEVGQLTASGIEGVDDDLQKIDGVGPKTEAALKASGVTSYAQIAEMEPAELERIVKEEHSVRLVGDANSWPQQAAFLAQDDMEGLAAYQASLAQQDDN